MHLTQRNPHLQPHLAPSRALPQRPNNVHGPHDWHYHLLRALRYYSVYIVTVYSGAAFDVDRGSADIDLRVESEWHIVSGRGVDGS